MKFSRMVFGVMLLGAIAGGWTAMGAGSVDKKHKHVEAADPFLWLEDIHGEKPMAWVKEQNVKSTAVLQADADYQRDYDSILKVMDATDRIPFGNIDHNYIFNFWQDASHPKGIWRRTTISDYANEQPKWDVLLDLDQLAADEKENWVWKGADCAASLKHCLVKLSKRGQPMADSTTIYEGKADDVADGAAVFRQPSGTIAVIQRGITFFASEYYLVENSGVAKLNVPLGANLKGAINGNLIFTLRDDWTPPGGTEAFRKGSLIAAPALRLAGDRVPATFAVLYMPDAKSSIDEVSTGRDAVYASIYNNVTGAIHAFHPGANGTWNDTRLNLPAGGSTHIVSTNDWGPEAQFRFESYVAPTTLFMEMGDGKPVAIKSLSPRFDASNLATEQFFATSKDGTQIPYFVTRAKNLTGPAPTVLYGYGGFEVSMTPSYSPNFGLLWLNKGGVFVVANIRGGGEFGPAWHQAALNENRQKAYDDFQAVAADIEKRGITTPKQLGIMGGSNGGLLVSANMVERPDLFGAVVCQVPLVDMIRYTHIGAGASWIAEYGDPADPKARAWIMKYSPYQNVSADKTYPPVLFVTATSDDRVTPVHARKMAARMEAQGHDVLFYENTDGGHAAAANHKQAAEMWALSLVYLKQKLGLK